MRWMHEIQISLWTLSFVCLRGSSGFIISGYIVLGKYYWYVYRLRCCIPIIRNILWYVFIFWMSFCVNSGPFCIRKMMVKNRSNNSVAASCRAYANNDSGSTKKGSNQGLHFIIIYDDLIILMVIVHVRRVSKINEIFVADRKLWADFHGIIYHNIFTFVISDRIQYPNILLIY